MNSRCVVRMLIAVPFTESANFLCIDTSYRTALTYFFVIILVLVIDVAL